MCATRCLVVLELSSVGRFCVTPAPQSLLPNVFRYHSPSVGSHPSSSPWRLAVVSLLDSWIRWNQI